MAPKGPQDVASLVGGVDVGHTVCPTFKQHLQCGNPAPHS